MQCCSNINNLVLNYCVTSLHTYTLDNNKMITFWSAYRKNDTGHNTGQKKFKRNFENLQSENKKVYEKFQENERVRKKKEPIYQKESLCYRISPGESPDCFQLKNDAWGESVTYQFEKYESHQNNEKEIFEWKINDMIFLQPSRSDAPIGTIIKVDNDVCIVQFDNDVSYRHMKNNENSNVLRTLDKCRLINSSELIRIDNNTINYENDISESLQGLKEKYDMVVDNTEMVANGMFIGVPDQISLANILIKNDVIHSVTANSKNLIFLVSNEGTFYLILYNLKTDYVDKRVSISVEYDGLIGNQSNNLQIHACGDNYYIIDGNGCFFSIIINHSKSTLEPRWQNLLPLRCSDTNLIRMNGMKPVYIAVSIFKYDEWIPNVMRSNIIKISSMLNEMMNSSDEDMVNNRLIQMSRERVDGNLNILQVMVLLLSPSVYNVDFGVYRFKDAANKPSVSEKNEETPISDIEDEASTWKTYNDNVKNLWKKVKLLDDSIDWEPIGKYDDSDLSKETHLKKLCKERRTLNLSILKIFLKFFQIVKHRSTKIFSTIKTMFFHCTADSHTAFSYSIKLRCYDISILIFTVCKTLFSLQEEPQNNFTVSSFYRCLAKNYSNINSAYLQPMFMLINNNLCTFTWTSELHSYQDIYACKTCGFEGDVCCCAECRNLCHANHDVVLKAKSQTAYCDCIKKGKCSNQSFIFGSQKKRLELFKLLFTYTRLAYLPARNGESMLLYQIKNFCRKVTEYRRYCLSGKQSRLSDQLNSKRVHKLPHELFYFLVHSVMILMSDKESINILLKGYYNNLLSMKKSIKTSHQIDTFSHIIVNVCNANLFENFIKTLIDINNDETEDYNKNCHLKVFIDSIIRVFTIVCLENHIKNSHMLKRSYTTYENMILEEKKLGVLTFQPFINIIEARTKCCYIFKVFPEMSIFSLLKSSCSLISPITLGVPSPPCSINFDICDALTMELNDLLFNNASTDDNLIAYDNPVTYANHGPLERSLVYDNIDVEPTTFNRIINTEYRSTDVHDTDEFDDMEDVQIIDTINSDTTMNARYTSEVEIFPSMEETRLPDIDFLNILSRYPSENNDACSNSSVSQSDSKCENNINEEEAFSYMLQILSECVKVRKFSKKIGTYDVSTIETDKNVAICFSAHIKQICDILLFQITYSNDALIQIERSELKNWPAIKKTILSHVEPVWNWITPILDTLESQLKCIARNMYKNKHLRFKSNNIFSNNVGLSSVDPSVNNASILRFMVPQNIGMSNTRCIREVDTRKNFMEHILSLLRFGSNEITNYFPNANVKSLSHISIILDALLHLRDCIYKYEGKFFESKNENFNSVYSPNIHLNFNDTNRKFFSTVLEVNAFKDTTNYVVTFSKSVDESLPLVRYHHKLNEFTEYKDIFQQNNNFSTLSTEAKYYIDKIENIEDCSMYHSILNTSKRFPFFIKQNRTPIMNDNYAKRWYRSIIFFSRELNNKHGFNYFSMMKNMGGFGIVEAKIIKNLRMMRILADSDFSIKVNRSPPILLLSTFKQICRHFWKYWNETNSVIPISRFRVSFVYEPGEGSGVSRSFFIVFIEAIMSKVVLSEFLKNIEKKDIEEFYHQYGKYINRVNYKSQLNYDTSAFKIDDYNSETIFVDSDKHRYSCSINVNDYKISIGQNLYNIVDDLCGEHSSKIVMMILSFEKADIKNIISSKIQMGAYIRECLNIIVDHENIHVTDTNLYLLTFGNVRSMNDISLVNCRFFYEPSNTGYLVPQHVENGFMKNYIFKYIGFLMGVALQQNEMFHLNLCRPVVKYLLDQQVCWHDFAYYDLEAYEGLRKMLYRVECGDLKYIDDLDLYFNLQQTEGEGGKFVELIRNGTEVKVSSENVFDYVRLYTMEKMINCRKSILDSIKKGILRVMPLEHLKELTPEYFHLMTCGVSTVDINRLKRITKIQNESSVDHKRLTDFVNLFWSTVSNMSNGDKQKLIYFWMSRPQLPATSKSLYPLPSIAIRPPDETHLPTANTCVSRLYIPIYSSQRVLESKLYQAIETKSFGFV
ncbi:hypothetical protein A3Q56_05751 [Intoshia linei]|uniref:HECT-type E3 ubiquitin transferase n=1 Tax=Intoshia linei TaxID=1819745 RepID=A0A177AX01_9BILA|nr:hypothetical protein A3Q56_05751 [Intoshia linei]